MAGRTTERIWLMMRQVRVQDRFLKRLEVDHGSGEHVVRRSGTGKSIGERTHEGQPSRRTKGRKRRHCSSSSSGKAWKRIGLIAVHGFQNQRMYRPGISHVRTRKLLMLRRRWRSRRSLHRRLQWTAAFGHCVSALRGTSLSASRSVLFWFRSCSGWLRWWRREVAFWYFANCLALLGGHLRRCGSLPFLGVSVASLDAQIQRLLGAGIRLLLRLFGLVGADARAVAALDLAKPSRTAGSLAFGLSRWRPRWRRPQAGRRLFGRRRGHFANH